MTPTTLWAGIDVGSTTLKIAIIDPETHKLLHAVYRRHGAKQAACARELLAEAHDRFPDALFNVAVCGSGGRIISKAVEAHYIQEVVANSLAIRSFFRRPGSPSNWAARTRRLYSFITMNIPASLWLRICV